MDHERNTVMQRTPRLIFGSLLILLGTLFLLDNLGYIDAADMIADFWPLSIVLVGIAILLRSRQMPKSSVASAANVQVEAESARASHEDSSDLIVRSEVFGDIKLVPTSKAFAGASCNTVFGDIRLDLSNVELKPGESIIRLSTMFGDIKVDVTNSMEFASQASTMIGDIKIKGNRKTGFGQSLSYKTSGYDQAGRKVTIIMSSMFGDVKIY